MKTKWQHNTTYINDFRVERSKLQSGKYLYYVLWIENPHYAAPHFRMSDKMFSLQRARSFIKHLESMPGKYFTQARARETRMNFQETKKLRGCKMRKPNKSELIQRHLNNLAEILGIKGELLEVCYKSLKDIEHSGHRLAEKYCNSDIDSTQIEEVEAKLKRNLLSTLQYAKQDVVKNIQFNWDPRGYFLKLNDEYVRKNKVQIETDWGGYGIICPDGV